jgi:hypothetical protein
MQVVFLPRCLRERTPRAPTAWIQQCIPAATHVDTVYTALLGGLGEPLAVLNHFAPSLAQELPVLLWSRGWGNPRYDPVLGVGRNDFPSLMAIVPGVSALLYRTNTLPDHVP